MFGDVKINEESGRGNASDECYLPLHEILSDKINAFFPMKVSGVEVGSFLVKGKCFSLQYEPYRSWFSRWHYPKRVLGKDNLPKVNCFVIYFPDLWCDNPWALLQEVKSKLSVDGMMMIVMASTDVSGQDMCQWGDEFYQKLHMTCVMDRFPYTSGLSFIDDDAPHCFVIAQLWKGTQTPISLDQLQLYST